jgi:hypothetical protein
LELKRTGRIFRPKRNKMAGWRKLHNLIIGMITSREVDWAGYVAGMERRGMLTGYW